MKATAFVNGEVAYRMTIANQVDRACEAESEDGIHNSVLKLRAISEPILERDPRFQKEWKLMADAIEKSRPKGFKGKYHVGIEDRMKELGFIIGSLYRAGVIGKKFIPHDRSHVLDFRPAGSSLGGNGGGGTVQATTELVIEEDDGDDDGGEDDEAAEAEAEG